MSYLSPTIYVVCLKSYNTGRLHGVWLNADQDADDLRAAITEMLQQSPEPDAKDYVIHEFVDFGDLRIDKNHDLDTVSDWAKFIVEHGKIGAELIFYCNGDTTEASTLMEDCYYGSYGSKSDFVEEFLEQTGTEIPESLRSYIDYELMTRDWFISDFFSLDVDGKAHVFSNH